VNVVFELLCVDTNLEYEGKTAQEMVEAGEVDRKAHGLDSVEDTHGAGNGLLIYRIQPWEGAVRELLQEVGIGIYTVAPCAWTGCTQTMLTNIWNKRNQRVGKKRNQRVGKKRNQRVGKKRIKTGKH